MKNRKNQTVLYINYAPYGNTGDILTYMRETFQTVIYIEFIFHHLGKMQSAIYRYQEGKCVNVEPILQFQIPAAYVFIALPIRSFINFLQIIFHSVRLSRTYHTFDIFFSVNAFTSWCGTVLKQLHVVKKTIFWVWDYYPPIHKDKAVMLMRSFYWHFDKTATKSDKLVFLNNRLLRLRQDIGVVPKGKKFPIVGIGTHIKSAVGKHVRLPLKFAFLGAIKKSQGLDFIFDNEGKIEKFFPQAEFHIFGGGPDEQYFKKRAEQSGLHIMFHGFIPNNELMERELAKCSIGLALYKPEPDNVSYFGDPSKIKEYLCVGLPVVTTNVFEFSEEIIKLSAGMVISYNDATAFIQSIHKILKNYSAFSKNAIKLAKRYEYAKIYPKLFAD